jgi:hypothetical protein
LVIVGCSSYSGKASASVEDVSKGYTSNTSKGYISNISKGYRKIRD